MTLAHFFTPSKAPFITRFKTVVGVGVAVLVVFGATVGLFHIPVHDGLYYIAAFVGLGLGLVAQKQL